MELYKERLAKLRDLMASEGLDGFIVPRADEYLGEFVAPHAERLAWLTGFTGSAGVAVILRDKAVVMSDGRYTLQLEQQIPTDCYARADMTQIPVSDWLKNESAQGSVIGFDPWLHSHHDVAQWETDLGMVLKPVAVNLIDRLWDDRTFADMTQVELFPEDIAGRSYGEKIALIQDTLRSNNAEVALIAQPDSIAWLLNVRGRDVPHTPLVLSYALIALDSAHPVTWFVDPAKIPENVRAARQDQVEICDVSELENKLGRLSGVRISVDRVKTPHWFVQMLKDVGAEIICCADPCVHPRSIKTPEEQDGMRAAHRRDALAMIRLMMWLEDKLKRGQVREMDVMAALDDMRAQAPDYRENSFDTIAGTGPNGAIIHYRSTEESNAVLEEGSLFLLDSGGQYLDGTTDITRTFAIGDVSEEMKRHYTLVLKGHIALSRARFPKGTPAAQIDTLARQALWEEGLNFAHGTGHGVGCYLSVHEDAANISPRGTQALEAGMVLSNEPGYYKAGAYGIRIENLVLVQNDPDYEGFLCFETLTLVPYETRLIVPDLLSFQEKQWLRDYQKHIEKELVSLLSKEEQIFIRQHHLS